MRHFLFTLLLLIVFSCKQDQKNTKLTGDVFGTTYSIDSLFYVINKSMSTYQTNSDISRINRNETVEIDEHFKKVFSASQVIYEATEGIFDPTIGVLVNAWDFGPEGKIISLDSLKIDSLMLSVGLNKVKLVDNTIIKENTNALTFFKKNILI